MNLSPDVLEQVLWLGIYAAVLFLVVASTILTGFSILEAIHGRKDIDVIPTGGINLDVEREKAKLALQGKDMGNE